MRINGTHYRTIWPDPEDSRLIYTIDQRQLPFRLDIKTLTTVEDTYSAIKNMVVRGAGLIGATAAYGMYLAALNAGEGAIKEEIEKAAAFLKSARPTARNLAWAVDRVALMIATHTSPEGIRQAAFSGAGMIADEDVRFCKEIGRHGVELIREIWQKKDRRRVNILTHCNAGWLAFVDYGSATAPIYAARDAGIEVHVWVDETRPWNQGSRLTAWELQQEGIPNTLITDNAGGHIMQRGDVDLVLVGTDRTTHTGDVANKIGTYLKALAAKDNNIPFFVALPSSTFDWSIDSGIDIPIEERSGDEITTIAGRSKNDIIERLSLAAPGTQALNYSFDVTPARLVSALITERGIVRAEKGAIHSLFPEFREHCK